MWGVLLALVLVLLFSWTSPHVLLWYFACDEGYLLEDLGDLRKATERRPSSVVFASVG